MACQKVCKQVINDIKVKPHPYIFFTLHCTVVGKRCRDGQGFVYYLHFYIISNLFAYFLACHLYNFKCFLF